MRVGMHPVAAGGASKRAGLRVECAGREPEATTRNETQGVAYALDAWITLLLELQDPPDQPAQTLQRNSCQEPPNLSPARAWVNDTSQMTARHSAADIPIQHVSEPCVPVGLPPISDPRVLPRWHVI